VFDFKDPVPDHLYLRLWRSRDPVREIKILEKRNGEELVDRKKAREKLNKLRRLLLSLYLLVMWMGLSKCVCTLSMALRY